MTYELTHMALVTTSFTEAMSHELFSSLVVRSIIKAYVSATKCQCKNKFHGSIFMVKRVIVPSFRTLDNRNLRTHNRVSHKKLSAFTSVIWHLLRRCFGCHWQVSRLFRLSSNVFGEWVHGTCFGEM